MKFGIQKFATVTMMGALALLTHSANAAVADSACCTSGNACAAMIKEVQASCTQGNASLEDTCKVLQGLSQYEWLLQNPDLSPLRSDAKDIAGTYQVKVGGSFVLVNKWMKGDAPGITQNDSSKISLTKICYSTRDVQLSGTVSFFKVPFNLSFRSDLQSVQGKRGYFAEGGARTQKGRYFFSPVTPDRQPIEL